MAKLRSDQESRDLDAAAAAAAVSAPRSINLKFESECLGEKSAVALDDSAMASSVELEKYGKDEWAQVDSKTHNCARTPEFFCHVGTMSSCPS